MTQIAKPETETDSNRRWLDDLKTREFAPRVQVVIAWDGAHLVAEAPGKNGMREKIEGVSLANLPTEIQAVLIGQLADLKALKDKKAPAIERRDLDAERRERNAKIALDRAIADKEWLDSLSVEDRAYEESKREEKRLAIIEAENARARDIWRRTASKHSVELADRVIADPTRRPNQRVVIAVNKNGTKVTYNPRFDTETKTDGQKRARKVNEKLNLDLGL